jgi:hypothetical protein
MSTAHIRGDRIEEFSAIQVSSALHVIKTSYRCLSTLKPTGSHDSP